MPVGDLVYPAVFRTPEPPTSVFAESAKTFPPQPPTPPQSVFHAPILAPDTHPPDVTFFDAPTPVKTDVALQSQPFVFVAPEAPTVDVIFSQLLPPQRRPDAAIQKPTLIFVTPQTHPPDVAFYEDTQRPASPAPAPDTQRGFVYSPTYVFSQILPPQEAPRAAVDTQRFLFVAPEVAIDVVFFSQPPPQPTEVSLEKPTLIFVTPATHPPDIIFSESPPPPPPPPWLFQQNHHFVEAPAPPQPDFIAVPAQVPFQVAAFLPLGEIFIVVIPGPRGDESFSRGWYHTK